MGRKQISRKEFIGKTMTGVAGFSIAAGNLYGNAQFKMRQVGSTGIMVSPICFGAPRTNEVSLIKYALSKGINFIDTGRAYGNGNNEKLVGQAVTGIREKVVIQSKIRLEHNELPAGGKGKKGAEEIRVALSEKLDASLKELNTAYIDILLYHDAIEENLLFHPATLKFFDESRKSGVIRAAGFSTHNENMHLIEKNNSAPFYNVIMVPFNPMGSFVHSVNGRYSEWDQKKLIGILTEAGKKGTGVIAMKTCSGGKYSPSEGIEASYREAVKWVIGKDFISAAAIAMANFGQVDEYAGLV